MALDANQLYKERKELLSHINKINKEIEENSAKNIKDEQRRNKLLYERKSAITKLKDTNLLLLESQQKYHVDAFKNAKKLTGVLQPLGSLENERISMMKDQGGLSKLAITRANELASISADIAQLSKDDVIERDMLLDKFNHLLPLFAQQKGIGKDIVENFKKQRKISLSLSNISERTTRRLEQQSEVYKRIKDTVAGVFDTASQLLTDPLGAIGGAIVGLGFIADRFGEINRELGGVNRASLTFMSYFDSDAVGTFREISNQFGSVEAASFGTQINVSLIARTMGISGQEAAKLVGEFSRLNDGSQSMAKDMIATTREFAKQRGVIPAQVMSDLASSTDAFAKFGKEGGKNLLEAAVFARQLGTEFSTIEALADNILDFETSITSELELSAVLERNINLDRARALAHSNDLVGATKEIVSQLGGVAEWEKMGRIERQQSAQALGLGVGQLDQMIKHSEKVDTQAELIGQKFSRWASVIDAGVNEALGFTLKGLGGGLIMVGQWSHGLAGISKLMEVFKLKQLGIWAVEKLRLGWAQLKLMFATKELGVAKAQLATEKAIAAAKSGDVPGGGIGGMLKGLNPTVMLKGAAAIAILAGSLFIFGKALQEFQDVGLDEIGVAVAGLTMLTGAAIALGFAGQFVLTGAAAIAVLAGSIWILGKGLQEMATGIQMMSSLGVVISEMVSQTSGIMKLTGALFSLASGLTAVGLAGMISLPGLMAVQVATTVVERITGGGVGEGGVETESMIQDHHDELISEIKGLRHDLQSGKIAVYIDRDKVSKSVTTSINESKVNSHGLL